MSRQRAGRTRWWSRTKTNDVDVFFAGVTALVLATIGSLGHRAAGAVREAARGASRPAEAAREASVAERTARDARALALLAGLGVLLSLGPATPIYRWLYDVLPPLRGIRAAARFGMLALVAIAFAASFGVAWLERTKRIRPALLAGLLLTAITIEAWQGPLRTMAGAQRAPAIYGWLAGRTRRHGARRSALLPGARGVRERRVRLQRDGPLAARS